MNPRAQTAFRIAWPTAAGVIGAGVLVLLAASSSPAGEMTMYESAPSAEKMAAILLGGGGGDAKRGGRTRSIRMKIEPAPEPAAPGILGFTVHFALDPHRIEPTDRPFLDELARALTLPEMESAALVVEGHTDARGSDLYNDSLSRRRAESVITYLVERHGIAGNRLIPVGQGERELLDAADPTAAVNRRVQFYLPGAKQ